MHPIELTLEALNRPGLGVLAIDDYADRIIKRRCLDGSVGDALVRAGLGADLLGSSLAGVLLSPRRFAALAAAGGHDLSAAVGVRIDGFGDPDAVDAAVAGAAEEGADFIEVHANRTPAWQDPALGHVSVEAIARTARAAQEHGILPVVGIALHGLDDGSMAITRAVTVNGLRPTMQALDAAGVDLTRCVVRLPPIGPGAVAGEAVSARDVAAATLDVLEEVLPPEVPAAWLHSAGHGLDPFAPWLQAVSSLAVERRSPWHIGFAAGRALLAPAVDAWAEAGPARGRLVLGTACRTLSRSLQPALEPS